MKKLLCVLVAAMLLCGVLAVAETAAEPVLTLYVTQVTQNGITMNPADMGLDLSIVFYEDGTGLEISNGEETPMTWVESEDGTVTVTDDTSVTVLTPAEDGWQADVASMTMTFGTEKPVAVDLGSLMEAADASAFNGTWECAYIDMDGTIVPVSVMADYWTMLFGSEDFTVTVADCAVTAYGDGPYTYTFADGTLTYSVEGNDLSERTLALTDGGFLVYTVLGMNTYCAAR